MIAEPAARLFLLVLPLLLGGCLDLGRALGEASGEDSAELASDLDPARAQAEVSADRSERHLTQGWRWRGWGRSPQPEYPLDDISRRVAEEGTLECPEVELVRHRGEALRYSGGGVRVAEAFVPKLVAFEEVVAEVAEAHYGREPARVLHLGTYNCRRVRGRPYRMSEHALGNGIDVRGFSFGAAPREGREALPPHLRWRFTVTVGRHWNPERERDAVHAAFLRRLTEELSRRDIFRGMLGPRHPRHHNHFHFDFGPWRYRIL